MARTLPRYAVALALLAAAPARGAPAVEEPELAALLATLVRGSPGEASRAAERLRYLGPSRAGPALRTLLASDDVRTRVAASAALVIVRDPRSAAALAGRLVDDEWEVRRNAADALSALRARSSVSALEKCVLEDRHARVRRSCVRALGEIGGGARALARCAGHDGELELRLAALDALAKRMDRGAAPALRPLLRDGSGLVRFAAARALAWMGDAAGRSFLAAEAVSADPEHSRRAVQVLADVPKSWALDQLARALASTDLPTRHAAAVGLAKRGDARGGRQLARLSLQVAGEEQRLATRACDDLGWSPEERQRLAAAAP